MNKLNEYWDNIHLKYNSTYDNWLNKYLSLIDKEDSIIELGCGRAYCSKYLLNNNYKNIIACDFSEEVLKIIKKENPSLKIKLFDMSNGLPFKDNSINIIIADLCLHYFDSKTTKYMFDEIYRVLKKDGYLIARVNSCSDKNYIPKNSIQIEKNYYYDGTIYKKFFEEKDFNELFKKYEIHTLIQNKMTRYEKTKILWEFCIKKKKENKTQ